jgi:replicative DNA helicase
MRQSKERRELSEAIFLNSPDAEQNLIGLCLSDRDALRAAIAGLDENCFSSDKTVAVFRAFMQWDFQRGIPTLTAISEAAKPAGVKQADLVKWKLLAMNEEVEDLIATLHRYRMHRQFADLLQQAMQTVTDLSNDPHEIAHLLQTQSQQIITVGKKEEPQDYHHAVIAKIIEIKNGTSTPLIPTGISKLNEMLCGGYEPATLNIIGARSGVGKSALALFSLFQNNERGVKGGFVSVEMTHDQIARREFAMLNHIPYGNLKEGKVTEIELHEMMKSADKFLVNKFYREVCGQASMAKLRAIISRMVYNQNCRYVVIDYLQRLEIDSGRNLNQAVAIGLVCNAIKAMAIQFNVPIILLSQLNRNSEKEGRAPGIFDLRDSGMIEEAADTILLLDRPENREDDPRDELGNSLKGKMILSLVKNRDGEGYVKTAVNANMALNLFGEFVPVDLHNSNPF